MNFEKIKTVLDGLADPVEKLEFVMDIGKSLPPVPENAECTEIVGCSSFVQICKLGNNFFGVADSAIVRGIVAIMISMVDGETPAQIKNKPIEKMFAELNLNLGAARLNGINSMIRFFKNL